MTSKADVEAFVAQKSLAVVGVSRSKAKFGTMVYTELQQKGYRVFAINPNATEILGAPCYPSLKALPEPVGGAVIVVPPAAAEAAIRDAAEAGISRLWLQQGSESPEALRLCEEHGINVIHGECILMFAKPVGFMHRLHRWVWGLLGKLPSD